MTKAYATTTIAWDTVGLGTKPDDVIAARLGVHRVTVCTYRRARGIPAFRGGGDRRPWSEHEENALADLYWNEWTGRGRARLARELGRTVPALLRRAEVLELRERAAEDERWPKKLGTWARETGYEVQRIRSAARRAGVTLRRGGLGPRAHYAITERQATKLLAELAAYPDGARMFQRRQGEWRPGQVCRGCGKTRLRRMARELCSGCYMRDQRRQRTEQAA